MKLFDFFHKNDKTEAISNPQDVIDAMLTNADISYEQGNYAAAFTAYKRS